MKKFLLSRIRWFLKIHCFEKIMRRVSADRSNASFWVKLLPPNQSYQKGTYRTYTSPEGLKFSLDISDLVDWYLYYGIKEEAHEKLYSLCPPQAVYLDIGTNIGAVLIKMASINIHGQNHGFEPDVYNFEKCKKNIELNKLDNVKVNNFGLGETLAEAYMVVPDEHNRGMNRVRESSTQLQGNTEKVRIETLDNYVNNNGFHSVDLIKIDTEGYEMKVLLGGHNTLRKYSPILFIELDDQNLREQGNSAKELISFLTDLNYRITIAGDDRDLPASFDYSNCHFDIIARNGG